MLRITALKNLLLIGILFSAVTAFSQKKAKPVAVIFDTDMGPDYDDVGAIAMLHAFADKGEANILATIASTKYDGVGAVLSVLNTYFRRADIPIGVPRGQALVLRDFQHWSDTLIANYSHTIKKNDETMDAVSLYRKVLAKQPDNSVTIITVGFLTNISNLLQSGADEYSKLSGAELVNKKVKSLVSMAGKFPSGSEFNVDRDPAASRYVFQNFKKPVILSGFEIGVKIKSGIPLIKNFSIKNSPVKDVFRISIPLDKQDSEGRMSWDETAVFVAVRGVQPYYSLECGTMVVKEDGSNSWDAAGKSHCRLVEARPHTDVEKIINELIMHQPQPR
jgi:inosine-uridine nucleoside N-ribohydrolase